MILLDNLTLAWGSKLLQPGATGLPWSGTYNEPEDNSNVLSFCGTTYKKIQDTTLPDECEPKWQKLRKIFILVQISF